jgi:hypothetical protein
MCTGHCARQATALHGDYKEALRQNGVDVPEPLELPNPVERRQSRAIGFKLYAKIFGRRQAAMGVDIAIATKKFWCRMTMTDYMTKQRRAACHVFHHRPLQLEFISWVSLIHVTCSESQVKQCVIAMEANKNRQVQTKNTVETACAAGWAIQRPWPMLMQCYY